MAKIICVKTGIMAVESRDRKTNLSNIETSEIFFKDVSFNQKIEEISTTHELQNLLK